MAKNKIGSCYTCDEDLELGSDERENWEELKWNYGGIVTYFRHKDVRDCLLTLKRKVVDLEDVVRQLVRGDEY